jgi:ankyrin repeat protein
MKFRDSMGLAALLLASFASPALAQFVPYGDQLVEAIRKDDGARALELLRDHPTLVNNRDTKGDTPLIVAIRRSDSDWTGYLLKAGADPDAAAKDGETPLIAAARNDMQDVIRWLLTSGAKIDAPNKLGETALIIGVQARNARLVRALLDAGANPDKTDYTGYSARDHAKRDTRSRQMSEIIEAKKPKK